MAAGHTGADAFDAALAERCDIACAAAIAVFLFGYSLCYRLLWRVRSFRKRGGANQKWTDGGYLRNRVMKPVEGWCFHADRFAKFKTWLGMGEQLKNVDEF